MVHGEDVGFHALECEVHAVRRAQFYSTVSGTVGYGLWGIAQYTSTRDDMGILLPRALLDSYILNLATSPWLGAYPVVSTVFSFYGLPIYIYIIIELAEARKGTAMETI